MLQPERPLEGVEYAPLARSGQRPDTSRRIITPTRRSVAVGSIDMKTVRAVRLVPALLALLIGGSEPLSRNALAQQTPSGLRSPESFFGFRMGADRKLANWDKLLEYYRLLAKSSNKNAARGAWQDQ